MSTFSRRTLDLGFIVSRRTTIESISILFSLSITRLVLSFVVVADNMLFAISSVETVSAGIASDDSGALGDMPAPCKQNAIALMQKKINRII